MDPISDAPITPEERTHEMPWPVPDPAAPGAASPPAPDAALPVEPATTVTAVTTASVGGSRVRWLIGGGIALAATAGLVLAAALLGARPLPEVLKYMPADSAVVAEFRPEFPGDQRQNLGNFLARFPGFEDQSILTRKLDETLDRIVSESSGGAIDYATQVKPVIAGPMALSISASGLREMAASTEPSGSLLVATTDGSVTCDSILGATTIAETYRDVEIRIGPEPQASACALDGRYLLAGDAGAIRSGLDARRDGQGIDGNATYRTARDNFDGDQLATILVNGEQLRDLFTEVGTLLGQPLPEAAVQPWAVAGLRVQDDALVLDVVAPPVPGPAVPSGAPSLAPAAESRFAGLLPADTLGFVEVHGVGAFAERGFAVLRADPAQAQLLAPIEGALGVVGGADNVVGWIEDVGVAVLPAGDGVGGALLIRGTDAAAVTARVTQIRNLLVLASTGTDITVGDSDYKGVTITSVDLGDPSTLLKGLGLPGADVGNVGDVPLQFTIAARDDLVLIAYGQGVVERILDVDPASSLRSTASYMRAVQLSGPTNDLQLYVALDSAVALIDRFIPAGDLEAFNRDVKPYLAPLAGTSWSSTTGTDVNRARFVLTVK